MAALHFVIEIDLTLGNAYVHTYIRTYENNCSNSPSINSHSYSSFHMYRSIQTPANANAKYSIHTLDTPGFQDPESVRVTTGTSFDNLCHNYSQERLQMLFHDSTFTAEQDRYIQVSILLSLYNVLIVNYINYG